MKTVEVDRPYRSIILENYLEYLAESYPSLNTAALLNKAGIAPWEVADPGHWFTQQQMNNFYEEADNVISADGDISLARAAGRFMSNKRASKYLRQAVASMMTPDNALAMVNKVDLFGRYTKAISVKSRRLKTCKWEVTVSYKEGIKPSPHQCENILGHLEAVIHVLSGSYPEAEHPECFFKGNPLCRYVLSWEITKPYRFKVFRNFIGAGASVLAIFLLIIGYGTAVFWSGFATVILFLLLTCNMMAVKAEKEDIINTFERHDLHSMDLTEGHARFHDYTTYFAEAAKSLSSRGSVLETLENFANSLKELGYQKGLVCLVEPHKNEMKVRYVYGEGKCELENSFESIKSRDKFNAKKILFHRDLEAAVTNFPPPIMEYLKSMQKPAYFPLVFELSLIGFLLIDCGEKKITAGDILLVQAIANQSALVIKNIWAFEEVRESERLKNEFLTLASHEMRTPIQGIFMAHDKLASRFEADRDDEINEALLLLEKAAQRLNLIIESKVRLSRLESIDNLSESTVSIERVFNEVKIETQGVIAKYGHNFECHPIKGVDLVWDIALVVQMLTNLINNAGKFTPRGGTIVLRAKIDKNEVALEVEDNGCGIPASEHSKVFLRFYQANSIGATLDNEGCGLGLSICQEVARKHGGYITINSPLNEKDEKRKGSLFVIHLPLERVAYSI